jgi:hypothetical protein
MTLKQCKIMNHYTVLAQINVMHLLVTNAERFVVIIFRDFRAHYYPFRVS